MEWQPITVKLDYVQDPDLQQLNMFVQLFLQTEQEAHQPILDYLNSRFGFPQTKGEK